MSIQNFNFTISSNSFSSSSSSSLSYDSTKKLEEERYNDLFAKNMEIFQLSNSSIKNYEKDLENMHMLYNAFNSKYGLLESELKGRLNEFYILERKWRSMKNLHNIAIRDLMNERKAASARFKGSIAYMDEKDAETEKNYCNENLGLDERIEECEMNLAFLKGKKEIVNELLKKKRGNSNI